MKFHLRLFVLLLCALLHLSVNASIYVHDGYTDKRSYNPGDTVHVYLNGISNFSNAHLYLYNINNITVDAATVNLYPQFMNIYNPWENGFGYVETFQYIIPHTMHSGVYSWEGNVFFIVKSGTKNAAITLIYPTNTEEAYNPAGGKSLYDFNSPTGKAHIVSFQRPYSNWMITEARGFSTAFVQWMNTLNYDYQMIADVDVDDYSEFQNSRLLVVVGHSEYWTRAARLNFDAFVNGGKDAVVLSGNTMWWQVRYSADKKQLICYKDSASDPEPNPLLKTITWPSASLQYSVLGSIGVDWIHGAYANNLSYHGFSGFNILLPSSPLFAGTGLTLNSVLSCQATEDDATLFSGFHPNGDPILDSTTLGFCKIELLGYDWGASLSYPNAPAKGYGTFVAFRKTPYSGNIINVGNSNWCGSHVSSALGGFGGADVLKIKTITTNMFDLLLSGGNIYSNSSGCAVSVNAIVPAENFCRVFPNPTSGKLFVRLNSPAKNKYELQILNAMGQIVQMETLEQTNEQEVDVANLAEGTYYYFIQADDEIISRGKIMAIR